VGGLVLTLSIALLTGRSVSSEFYDYDRPEWPPHPARVFFALVSSLHEGGASEQARQALTWLEQQKPPEVYASECSVRKSVDEKPVTVFVPVNSLEVKKGETSISEGVPILRMRRERTFPTVIPFVPTVYLVWRDAAPPEGCIAALSELAGRVCYLGHSSSLVALRFDEGEPQTRGLNCYVPSEDGNKVLRVPRRGLLEELEDGFASRGEEKVQLPHEQARYRLASQQESKVATLGRMFDSRLITFRGVAGTQPLVTAAFRVTSALRGALIKRAIAAGVRVPEVVSGHRQDGSTTEKPHMAIIPLPDVGHRHASGSLKGVAFVLPTGLAQREREEALVAVGSVGDEVRLRMGSYGEWVLKRDPTGGGLASLSPEAWVGPSRRWATVTPIVLDRFPRRPYSSESAEIIGQSCARAGLPRPLSVEVAAVSWFTGVPPVHNFVPYRKEGVPPRIHVHARIEFESEVEGPVVVGAGRFLGMGLMRPLG
jgi:CRISPR-associated protein Csb2